MRYTVKRYGSVYCVVDTITGKTVYDSTKYEWAQAVCNQRNGV